MLDADPPEGYRQWNGRLVAEKLGDVSDDQVWCVLRKHKDSVPAAAQLVHFHRSRIRPQGRRCRRPVPESTGRRGRALRARKASHSGLGESAQRWLRLPNGKALNGFSHCYKRHGTSTLFAALEVATGQVQVGYYPRRRRREFLDFMNDVLAQHSGSEIHVILGQPQHTQA